MRLLCLRCSTISDIDMDNLPENCPACHHQGIPANIDTDTVTVETTWHELRCIVMWAERWAGSVDDENQRYTMQRVVGGIARRIQEQHLDKSALTFTGELMGLHDLEGVSDVQVHGLALLPPDLRADERCGSMWEHDGRRCESIAGHEGTHRNGTVTWGSY